MHQRKDIMVGFTDLSDDQRIERLEALARAALTEYGWPGATLTHRSYLENTVFELLDEASGTHGSLRVCRSGWEAGALQREICWLEALARDTELRIPAPIRASAGKPFCVVEATGVPGPRACVLFGWVDGDYAAPNELTPSRLHRAGRFLAGLHEHAESFRLPPELAIERFDADALETSDYRSNVATYFKEESALAAFDEAIVATARLMRDLGNDATVAGIIHGDFHQRNYVFDGERVGALDFETMSWGHYLYDLATTLSYLVPEFLRDVDPEPLRAAVLEGYARIRALPKGYGRMLRIFSAYRVWIMADWSSGSPRMLEHDWARRRLDAMPGQIRELLAGC